MVIKLMNLAVRRELQSSIRQKSIKNSSWAGRRKLLNGLVAATGFERKYAISLLNDTEMPAPLKKWPASQKYDEQARQALISVWFNATQICSKRLVPFLPQLVSTMEHHRQLRLPAALRTLLLSFNPATEKRMLRPGANKNQEKHQHYAVSGNLLKH